MSARILDGATIAASIYEEITGDVQRLRAGGVHSGLAAVLVGHDPASEVYVRSKVKACETLSLYSEKITPSEMSSTEEILELIADLNRRDEIDGILVQLPLPKQIDAKKVLLAVAPEKDV